MRCRSYQFLVSSKAQGSYAYKSLVYERKIKMLYNHHRVHASLGGPTPAEDRGSSTMKEAKLDYSTWEKHCHGLAQLPRAA